MLALTHDASLPAVSFHVVVDGLLENGEEEISILHRDAHGGFDAECLNGGGGKEESEGKQRKESEGGNYCCHYSSGVTCSTKFLWAKKIWTHAFYEPHSAAGAAAISNNSLCIKIAP